MLECVTYIEFYFSGNNDKNDSNSDETDKDAKSDDKEEENKSQPWYFHVVASVILVVHGLTFLGKFEKQKCLQQTKIAITKI